MTSSAENTGYSPENAAQDAVAASGGTTAPLTFAQALAAWDRAYLAWQATYAEVDARCRAWDAVNPRARENETAANWAKRRREVHDGFSDTITGPAMDVEQAALDAVLRTPADDLADLHAKALLLEYAARLGDYTGELDNRDAYFADLARLMPSLPATASLPSAFEQGETERRRAYEWASERAHDRAANRAA